MKKRLIGCLLAAVMTVSLFSGCGGERADTGSTGTAQSDDGSQSNAGGEKIALNICWWGNQLRNDLTKQVCDLYMEENENVEINIEFMDWSGYWDKMSAMAAGGNLPDIYQQSVAYLNSYHDGNLMADLTPYIEDGTIDTSNIPDSVIESGSIDGKCYALSLGTNCLMMAYDPAIVEQAGVTLPERLTYEELPEIGRQIYEATGVKTYYFAPANCVPEHLMTVSRSMGHAMYEDIENGDNEAILEYFEIADLYNQQESNIGLEILAENTSNVEDSPIVDGTVWNFFLTSNQFIALSEAAGRELGIALFPEPENTSEEPLFMRASQFFSIAETSEHKEEAARFLDWFTNSKACNDILLGERGVPINTEILEGMMPSLDDTSARMFEYVNEVSEIVTSGEDIYPNGYEEINTLINTLLEDLYYGDRTPENAAAELLNQGKRILDEAAQ